MIIDKVWESTNGDDLEEWVELMKKREAVREQFDEYDKAEYPSVESSVEHLRELMDINMKTVGEVSSFFERTEMNYIKSFGASHKRIMSDITDILEALDYKDFVDLWIKDQRSTLEIMSPDFGADAPEQDRQAQRERWQARARLAQESPENAQLFIIELVIKAQIKALRYYNLSEAEALAAVHKKVAEWFPQIEKFPLIRQGTATNILTKIIPNEQRNTTINRITGIAKVEAAAGNATLTIRDFVSRAGFRTSTHQLLDALVLELTRAGAKSPFVSIPLSEYMEKRGIKNAKEARKQVNSDLQELYDATFSFQEKRKNAAAKDYHDIRIIDSKGIKKGIINISFGSVFYEILKGYPLMPYPSQLWRLDNKKNPNSYYLLRRISEHRNMNDGKKNADTIAVKTLLAAAPFLPTYDEVQSSNRNFRSRIIDKFERDMDALSDTLTWHYCHRNNTPVSDQELSTMDYELFESLLVNVQWVDYPDQTERHERQRQRIEAAKENQPKTAPKKKASSGTQSKSRARKKKPTDTQTGDKTKGTDKNKQ